MANAVIVGSGGGGATSSDVTATKANVLSGKTTVTSDSSDEVVSGTMTNNGAVSATLAINGTYTIPAGYHNGSGTVNQSITTLGATTYYATTSDQTIASGKYLSGTQTIKKLTQTNLTAANIKPGVVVSVNNGKDNVWSVTGAMSSLAAKTYYATTSDQTISSGVYLSGAQTIKAISHENLAASNIKKGVTVYIKNGNGNIYSVTGTWEGYVANSDVPFNRGTWASGYSIYCQRTYTSNYSRKVTVTNTGAALRVTPADGSTSGSYGGAIIFLPKLKLDGISKVNISVKGSIGSASTTSTTFTGRILLGAWDAGLESSDPWSTSDGSQKGYSDATVYSATPTGTNLTESTELTVSINVASLTTYYYIGIGSQGIGSGGWYDITKIWFS